MTPTIKRVSYSREERLALCALLDKTGPDAPTLCEGWTTGDLAAHLVLRERRPDAAAGVIGGGGGRGDGPGAAPGGGGGRPGAGTSAPPRGSFCAPTKPCAAAPPAGSRGRSATVNRTCS